MGLVVGIFLIWCLSFLPKDFYLAMLPTIIGFIAATIYILWIVYKGEHKDDNK